VPGAHSYLLRWHDQEAGPGAARKGTLKRERAGAVPLLSVGHFLFQAPSPSIFGSTVGSPVFRKNLGGSILAQMVAPVVAQHKKGLADNS
jgi:hypothetical protein